MNTAASIQAMDPDASVSRAYYAAFYGFTAYFTLLGQSFRKHSGLRSAVNRELVKPGKLPIDIGDAFKTLPEFRHRADYGGAHHVTEEEAEEAVILAERILRAIHQLAPDDLPLPVS